MIKKKSEAFESSKNSLTLLKIKRDTKLSDLDVITQKNMSKMNLLTSVNTKVFKENQQYLIPHNKMVLGKE